ncbi:MAG: tetratricopeptide repeat protein [Acetobacteraceae bacterium]|nr:tetratricopeptide repeat protein [Acetobacteraceae bacterium]
MPDIFDEIEQDLRAERAQQFLKRYGTLLIAAALMVVGITAGWQVWRWWESKRDQQAASEYLAGMSQADSIPPGAPASERTAAIASLDKLVASAPEGYRILALLRVAALKADAGDKEGAEAAWNQVAANTSADPALRDLASLLWAQHQIDHGDPALVEARLKPLESPDNPWHTLAQESQALLDVREGHTDQAREALRHLAQDVTASNDLRARASALLSRIGG